MLDLVYIGLVALPLGIAATAMLLMAWRALRGPAETRRPRAMARPPAAPEARTRSSSLVALSELVESLAFPPRAEPTPLPAPVVAAPVGAATKRCPDCAEEVLAAARVCKHCRYRFDEPQWGAGSSLSA